MVRSPLEYAACFQGMPVFLGSGFDLSIDDCVNKGLPTFKDYGQCERFEETIDSGWWSRHRSSYAGRQLFAAERGLGWSFATWKLYDDDTVGVLDNPAKLLALKDVSEAGLFPNLKKDFPAKLACLNPPVNDFMLGDETLAPSMGPPPDCGNGWWNYDTKQCNLIPFAKQTGSFLSMWTRVTNTLFVFLLFRRLLDPTSTSYDVSNRTMPRVRVRSC